MHSCQPIRDLFHAYLEGELDPAAQASFLEHLKQCPACCACLEECRPASGLLREGLPESMPEAAIARLEHRLSTRLADAPAPAWWRRFAIPVPVWAIAGLLLIAGSGLWIYFQGRSITLQGWLIDGHCAPKFIAQGLSGASHLRSCDLKPECRRAGYGVLAHGRFVRFDAHGNAVAFNALLHTHAPDHLRVVVSGRKQNHVLHVARLKLMAPAAASSSSSGDGSDAMPAAAR